MFRAQSVSFSLFKILPIQKRVKLASDPNVGASLLSALTPTEYAEMFPKYYQRLLPDVSGFQEALTQRTQKQQQEADDDLKQRLVSLEEDNNELKQDMEKLGISKDKMPSLTEEQSAAYTTIQTGDVAIDSEQGKMFSSLDNEKLASVGISVVTNDKGEKFYHYTPPATSKEEAVSRLQTTAATGDSISAKMAAEKYLGRSMSDKEWDWVVRTTAAEATSHKGETAMVMASILNRARSGKYGGNTIEGVVSAPKQFSSYTNRSAFKNPPDSRKSSIFQSASMLGGISHNQTDFASANPRAYDKEGGRGEQKIAERVGKGFTLVGGQYFNAASQSTLTTGQPIKPEGPGGKYSDKQISDMMAQLAKEKDAARRQQLANVLQSQGVQVAPGATSPGAARVAGSVIGGFHGESEQCVALSKHFAPQIGTAKSWEKSIHYDPAGAGIKPGSVIATTSYNDGSGGKMARQMPDHQSHYHTGVALTTPDAQGNVLILDQSVGRPAQIHKINIHNYHGEKWGVVPNGAPTPRSMQAVHMAMAGANPNERQAISDSLSGQTPSAQSTAPVQETKRVTESPNSVPKKTERQDPTPANNVPSAKPEQQMQQANKTAVIEKTVKPEPAKQTQEEPKTVTVEKTVNVQSPKQTSGAAPAEMKKPVDEGPKSYTLNRAALIAAIRETDEFKNTFGSSLATDDMIYNGFLDDPRTKNIMAASKTSIDASGNVKVGDFKKLQESMSDMNVNKFLKPIPAHAGGGKEKVNGPLDITPIESQRGDNTLATDTTGKQFTFNSDRETLDVNPQSNVVKIEQNKSVDSRPVTKENRNDMRVDKPKPASVDNTDVIQSIDSMKNEVMSKLDNTAMKPNPMPLNPVVSTNPNLINQLQDMTRTPYLNPAFERAVSRAGGSETGSAIGNRHFSIGNKDG